MRLSDRVSKLEQVQVVPKVWRRIIQRSEQTQEQALAEHEAENGPLGDDVALIVRAIVKPTPRRAAGND